MTHYRTELRTAAKAALKSSPLFADARCVLSSARVDVEAVPCWSVSTPSENRTELSRRQFQADTDLVVAASIRGAASEIEDRLDDHAEIIEALIVEGIKTQTGAQSVTLRRTETKTGPEDNHVTGSVMMLFVVTGFIQDE